MQSLNDKLSSMYDGALNVSIKYTSEPVSRWAGNQAGMQNNVNPKEGIQASNKQ